MTILPDAPKDFDFLVGKWRVHHRRLQRRLVGDTQWDEFGGSSELRLMLGGFGTFDDNVIELPGGTYRAVTIRQYDPKTRQWSIWWIDGRHHGIGAPLKGAFKDGIGTFFGDDELEGRPIRARFIWSDITANSARWQQAFSTDGGQTWEDNWFMRFERVA
jgi:hypothetical protein